MSVLDDLKLTRAELDKKIKAIEKENEKQRKADDIKSNYVQVVCLTCNGEGVEHTGGADILSDPPDEETCGSCRGAGGLLRRRFDGIRRYSLTHDEGDGV